MTRNSHEDCFKFQFNFHCLDPKMLRDVMSVYDPSSSHKSRKAITIPKIELIAAVAGKRLVKTVFKETRFGSFIALLH